MAALSGSRKKTKTNVERSPRGMVSRWVCSAQRSENRGLVTFLEFLTFGVLIGLLVRMLAGATWRIGWRASMLVGGGGGLAGGLLGRLLRLSRRLLRLSRDEAPQGFAMSLVGAFALVAAYYLPPRRSPHVAGSSLTLDEFREAVGRQLSAKFGDRLGKVTIVSDTVHVRSRWILFAWIDGLPPTISFPFASGSGEEEEGQSVDFMTGAYHPDAL